MTIHAIGPFRPRFDSLLKEKLEELELAEHEERVLDGPVERLALRAARLVASTIGRPYTLGGAAAYLRRANITPAALPSLDLRFPEFPQDLSVPAAHGLERDENSAAGLQKRLKS